MVAWVIQYDDLETENPLKLTFFLWGPVIALLVGLVLDIAWWALDGGVQDFPDKLADCPAAGRGGQVMDGKASTVEPEQKYSKDSD
jgi:hypothetical protein